MLICYIYVCLHSIGYFARPRPIVRWVHLILCSLMLYPGSSDLSSPVGTTRAVWAAIITTARRFQTVFPAWAPLGRTVCLTIAANHTQQTIKLSRHVRCDCNQLAILNVTSQFQRNHSHGCLSRIVTDSHTLPDLIVRTVLGIFGRITCGWYSPGYIRFDPKKIATECLSRW